MTDDRPLERAARTFIEQGPTRAPEAVVERALLLIEATSQERDMRIPWRFRARFPSARVAAAAVICVLAIGAAYVLGRGVGSSVGGPGLSVPPPEATAASSASASLPPSPLGFTRYVSPSSPYSIAVPGTWKIRPGDPARRADAAIYLKGEGSVGAGADWFAPNITTLFAAGYVGVVVSAHESSGGPGSAPTPATPVGVECPADRFRCTEAIEIGGEAGAIYWNTNQGIAEASVDHAGWTYLISSIVGGDPVGRETFREILGSIAFTN
ncbi:MAG TPA: hypothetical protein VFW02_11295 [Candidatus Limnocylindrales bacterium]|nr:hypothetical protein [Candidatus Limnocylindrales bacterium]